MVELIDFGGWAVFYALLAVAYVLMAVCLLAMGIQVVCFLSSPTGRRLMRPAATATAWMWAATVQCVVVTAVRFLVGFSRKYAIPSIEELLWEADGICSDHGNRDVVILGVRMP